MRPPVKPNFLAVTSSVSFHTAWARFRHSGKFSERQLSSINLPFASRLVNVQFWPEIRVHADYLSSEDLLKSPASPDQREKV